MKPIKKKEFDVFLQGANKDRVKQKPVAKGPVKMKKWKEDIGTLKQEDIEVLRQSIVQSNKVNKEGDLLSKSQQDLLKKLQLGPIDDRYDPHFSQMEDEDSDVIEEECYSEEEWEPQTPPKIQQQQQSYQVVQLPQTKPRPISAVTIDVLPQKQITTSKPQLRTSPLEPIKQTNIQVQQQKVQDVVTPNMTLDDILTKVDKLNENERAKLLDYLSRPTPKKTLELPKMEHRTIETKSSPEQVLLSSERKPLVLRESDAPLLLKIISTWGNPSLVGLTEIELYQSDGNKIQVQQNQIRMINASSLKPAEVLINGRALTRDAANMWLGSLPDPPKLIEIEFYIEQPLGGLKIYNYNKSLIDSVKGVKELEVIYQKKKILIEVKKGNGFDLDDYGTEVPLIEGFNFRARSRKGPIVVDVFKEERVETAKSRRIADVDKQMEQTLQYFNITNPGRFQFQKPDEPKRERREFVVEQKIELIQEQQPEPQFKVDVPKQSEVQKQSELPKQVDALDIFFKNKDSQQKPLSKWDLPQQAQQIAQPALPDRQKIKQIAEQNNQIIQALAAKDKRIRVTLPTMPVVGQIKIKIHSTWGDRYYVGLNGIEIFDLEGKVISGKIQANPSDINVLPEYSNDPRVVTNLLNGVHFTQSDLHVWLSPFVQSNQITIDIPKQQVSMIRIWNYNKSRTHSSRGVKDISLYLNDVIVFRGEIRKAPGTLSLGDQHFEIIAFTNDMNLESDWINRISVMPEVHPEERPGTGNLNTTTRPTTSAKVANLQKEIKQARMLEQRVQEQRVIPGDSIHTKMLILKILKPWGDQPFAGLTGIEFNDKLKFKIKADPSDLNAVHGHPKDKRVISNLMNENNITTDENDMWMIQFLGNRAHTITITFDTMVNITYLRIWNYNKSPEDAFKGVQFMQILNGEQFIGNVFLRRAPGTATHDYSQVITFPIKDFTLAQVEQVGRPIEGVMHPIGFELQIDIISTHGDIHYVGLNGMQILDYKGNTIEGVVGTDLTLDERVVQNLLTGDTKEESKMWLVPFTNRYFEHQEQRVNRVYFSSQSAFCLGMILFWNYSKTPQRGTYEIMISMDGSVIYKGYLRQTMTAIPFTRSMPQYAKDYYQETKGQEPRFRNEEKFTQKASYAQLERPQTKVKS